MPETLKEKIGGKELFHETLSAPECDLDITIERTGWIVLHQVLEIGQTTLRDSVVLAPEIAEQLVNELPRVIQKAKEIAKHGR